MRGSHRLSHETRITRISLAPVAEGADDAGESYRLFPLPNHQPDNPLSPSTVHRLPGDEVNWHVTNEGGREHFGIMVSPTFDKAVDAIVRAIPAAVEGRAVTRARIPTDSIGVLRGIGGLVSRTPSAHATEPSLLWYDGVELTGLTEKASGAWMRRLTVPGSAR